MAENIEKGVVEEEEEYEYIEISEGEDLPEGVEYEYVEEIDDESSIEEDDALEEVAEIGDTDVNMDTVLADILEDKPSTPLVNMPSMPKPPVADVPRIEEKPKEVEPVLPPVVEESKKIDTKVSGLSSEDLLAMAKAAMLDNVEKKPEQEPVSEPLAASEAPEDEEEEGDFNLDGEIEEEMVSMDDLIEQQVDLDDHVIDMGSLEPEPEAVIDNLVEEPVVDELSVAKVMDDKEYEYVEEEAFDDGELEPSMMFEVMDVNTVSKGAQAFLGNKGVEFYNGKEEIYIDVEHPEVWNLIIFDKKIVSLDEGVKEITLPRESRTARYATLVKNGQEKLDLFNEEKFSFASPTTEFFKGKEHFIYGKIGQTSGLVVNDVVTIPVVKFKGKQIVSKKPMSGMIVGGNSVLYFNGASKIIA